MPFRSPTTRRRARALFALFITVAAPLCFLSGFPTGQGEANAGDLKARVVGVDALRPSALTNSSASVEKHAYTLREADPLVPEKYRTVAAKADKDIAVVLFGAGDGRSKQAIIRLAGGRAVPATVVVSPSTAVIIKNSDPFTHHIVGPDNFERDLTPNDEHKIQPTQRGVITFSDTLVPSVRLWIVVEDNVLLTQPPSPDGSVRITDLMKAEYVLKAYFEGTTKVVASPTFTVQATGSVELKEPLVMGSASAAGK